MVARLERRRSGRGRPCTARRFLGRAALLLWIYLFAVAGSAPAAHAQTPQPWLLSSFEVHYTTDNVETKSEVIPAEASRDFPWGGTKQYDRYPFGTLTAEANLHLKVPDRIVAGQSFNIGTTATGSVATPGRQGLHAAIMTTWNECIDFAICSGDKKSQYIDDVAGKTVNLANELASVSGTIPADPSKWPANMMLIFRSGIGTTTPGDPYWRIIVYAFYSQKEATPTYRLDLDADTQRLPPSGANASQAELTATLRGPDDRPVAGEAVQFRLDPTDMGSLTAASGVTGGNGEVRVRYRAPTIAQLRGRDSVQVVASVPSRRLERGLSISIQRYKLSFKVDPTEIPVEAVWRAIRVTADVVDFDGRPVRGDVVKFRVDPPDMGTFIGQTMTANQATTDAGGHVEGFYEPPPPAMLNGRDSATLYATNLTHGGEEGIGVRFKALQLLRSWPADGARDVDLKADDTIDLEFDRSIDGASITAQNLKLETLWHGNLGAAVETYGSGVKLRLTQNPVPDVGLRVTVRLAAGEGGIAGRDGSLLLGPVLLRFATMPRLSPKVIVSQVVDDPRDLLIGNLAVAHKPFAVRVEAGLDADTELESETVEVKLTGPKSSDTTDLTQAFYPGRWPPLVPDAAMRRGNSANFLIRTAPDAGGKVIFNAELKPAGATDDKKVSLKSDEITVRRWSSPQAATSVGIMAIPIVNDILPPYDWTASRGQMTAWWLGLADPAAQMLPLTSLSMRMGYLTDTTCIDPDKCRSASPWTNYSWWVRHVGRAGFFTRGFQHIVALVPAGFFDQQLADQPDLAAHPQNYHGAELSGLWSERRFEAGMPSTNAWPVSLMELGSPPEVLVHALGDALGLAHATGERDRLAGYDLAGDRVIYADESHWTGAYLSVMNEKVGAVPTWLTNADYNAFLDLWTQRPGFQPRVQAGDAPAAGAIQPVQASDAPAAASVLQQAPVTAMLVSGTLLRSAAGQESGTIEPLVTGEAVPSLKADGAGDYAVELRDGAGTRLSRYPFTPAFGPLAAGEQAGFLVTVPADGRAEQVVITHGPADLARRVKSAHAPEVRFTQPQPGGRYRGDVAVAWAGTDADGDALSYTLLARVDGGAPWEPLAVDTTANRFALASTEVPNGPDAALKVVVTDGFLSATATLALGLDNPLVVVAKFPADGTRAVPTSTRVLAQLRDPLDPAMTGDGALALFDPAGRPVAGQLTYDELGRTLVFVPSLPLAEATIFEARLAADVRGTDGRSLGAEHAWRFTTRGWSIYLPRVSQRGNSASRTDTPRPTRTLGPSRTPGPIRTATPDLGLTPEPDWTATPGRTPRPDWTATPDSGSGSPSPTVDVVATGVAATLTALAPTPTHPPTPEWTPSPTTLPSAQPTPTASPTTTGLAKVTVDDALTTGADANIWRMAFGRGEALTTWIHVVNSGPVPVTAAFDFAVTGAEGAVAALGWRGSLEVASGPGWFKLERAVPAALATGPYTFRGTVTYAGRSTAAESALYVARSLRLADDFANAASGWASGQDAGGTYGYLDGEYRFSYGVPDQWRWSSPQTSPKLADLVVETDVRMPGAAGGGVALVFGLNDDGSSFHLFETTRDGRYAVFRWTGADWEVVLSLRPSEWLRAGESPNHLMVVRDRGLTTLYANGHQITFITDIPAPAGRAAIYASSAGAGFDARFDNFRLYDLR